MDYRFEEIKEIHLPDVLEIYNDYIMNSTATFHLKPLSLKEMRELVFFENKRYRTFVVIEEGKICGYVYLAQHKKREAYDDTGEVTVYLRSNHMGKGLGTAALKHIEGFAKGKSFHVLIATICGENEKSIRLFEKNGYFQCAHYKEVGKKFGKWLDLVAYQKILQA